LTGKNKNKSQDNFSLGFELKNALIDVKVDFTDNEITGISQLNLYVVTDEYSIYEELLTPALSCHKDTAQGTRSPLLGALGRNAPLLAFRCVFMAASTNVIGPL